MDTISPAKVVAREETCLSTWVRMVRKEVEFDPSREREVYHCLSQPDYIAILAQTRSGLIPLVRQFRPAVETYTWELPAGLLEDGESPTDACRRELKEEAGIIAEQLVYLGSYYADTGRLENRIHAFFAYTSDSDPNFVSEQGMSIEFVTPSVLRKQILNGTFCHQLHLAVFVLAALAGIDCGLVSSAIGREGL